MIDQLLFPGRYLIEKHSNLNTIVVHDVGVEWIVGRQGHNLQRAWPKISDEGGAQDTRRRRRLRRKVPNVSACENLGCQTPNRGNACICRIRNDDQKRVAGEPAPVVRSPQAIREIEDV